jgi:hypothetical protein
VKRVKFDEEAVFLTEFGKIFTTAVLTAVAANFFGFFKDRRVASSKYTEESLKKIYVPIYKILYENLDPSQGYEGIYSNQFGKIKVIVDKDPDLCDPKLERIIWRIYEEIQIDSYNQINSDSKFDHTLYDEDRKLLEYVQHAFNKTRKSLGLPADIVHVYPILYKIRYSSKTYWLLYNKRKFKRKLRKK